MRDRGALGLRDSIFDLVARRIRLFTLMVLVGGLLLIAHYDLSWSTTFVVAAALGVVALIIAAIMVWPRLRAAAKGR